MAEAGKEEQKTNHEHEPVHASDHEPVEKVELPPPDESFLESIKDVTSKDIEAIFDKKNAELIKHLEESKADFAELKIEISPLDLNVHTVEKPTKFKEKIRYYPKRWLGAFTYGLGFGLIHFKYLLIWFFTETPKAISKVVKKIVAFIKHLVGVFKLWSKKRKIAFVVSMTLLSVISYFYLMIVKNKVLHRDTFYFYGSMDQLGEWAAKYEDGDHVEPFYHSPRLKAYSFQMQPIVANLKRKNRDRENPMGFFEFIIEGNSGDVVVEIKMRESELIDLVQRVIEDHRYDELDTADGMADLKNDIKTALNAKLNEGVVNRIGIRNFFIKP